MYGVFRAGGVAAALLMLASIAQPAQAASAATGLAPVTTQTLSLAGLPEALASEDLAAKPASGDPAAAPVPAPDAVLSLRDRVLAFVDYGNQDEEELCLAGAVYFEARSEPLEGQLAVAQVVLNRAASGIYPATICDVVTQPAQFSFIRGGKFPKVNKNSAQWNTALAIAEIARKRLAQQIEPNVLWYHANYVAPGWGRRLKRVAQLGAHIFYR